jgi:diguanylate cyclase (GGDEF)-like protein/hemerythrin-like metal-binding protein
MPSLFTWNESFKTELPSIDEQHLHLVGLINDLEEQVLSAETMAPETFAVIGDAVLEHTRIHFRNEKTMMDKAGLDPRHIKLHCAAHQSCLLRVRALVDLGNDLPLDRACVLVEYLVQWLANHVLGVDQSMARQIRAIEGGLSPAKAFESDASNTQSGTGPLLAALGELSHAVSDRNHELRTLNRELELRVQQRTADLEYANNQLQMLSTQDDLTGLPNRRFATLTLQQFWAEALRYGENLSVLLLDADHFKQVNDHFGHAEGDALLRALAALLRNAVRASDIVCRLGGDEFLVICPRTSETGAVEVAKKILAARQPYRTMDGVVCWNGAVSIGLAEIGDGMSRPDDLVDAADRALYSAKRQGGACMAGGQDHSGEIGRRKNRAGSH